MKPVLLIALVCATSSVWGSTISEVFGNIAASGKVCYQRTYLGALPAQQRVRTIKAIVGRTAAPLASPYLAIAVHLKDRPNAVYTQYMSCLDRAEGVQCYVDCDGGGMGILSRGTGLRLSNNGVLMSTCGGENLDEDGREINPVERIWLDNQTGGDDVFRLDPAALSQCSSVETYD